MAKSGESTHRRQSLPLSRPATPQDVVDLARQYGPACISALADVAAGGTDAARVSAANALLDRGFGKAGQRVEIGGSASLAEAILEGKRRAEQEARATERAGLDARATERVGLDARETERVGQQSRETGHADRE